MLNNKEDYSKVEVEQAKRDIQCLVKQKSVLVKVSFTNQDDIDRFLMIDNNF